MELKQNEYLTSNENIMNIGEFHILHAVAFHNPEGKLLGWLDFNFEKMTFEGDMEESAKVFFDYLKESLIDPYLKELSSVNTQ